MNTLKTITKSIEQLLNVKDEKIKSLQKELDISKTETKLYKTILEEKEQIENSNTLFTLVIVTRDYDDESTYCIGVFTLESLAIKAILKGLNKCLPLSKFFIHKVSFENQLNDVKVVYYYLEDSSNNDSVVAGIKNGTYIQLFYDDNSDFDESLYCYESIKLDTIQQDYFEF